MDTNENGRLCRLGAVAGAPPARGIGRLGDPLSIEGVRVVPHVQSTEMRYRQKTDFYRGRT